MGEVERFVSLKLYRGQSIHNRNAIMWRTSLLLLVTASLVAAQIPSLGWCPDYQAMANFNINRFLGSWHEAERYFTVSELGSRCVTTLYEKMPDGRVWVSNEIKNAFTGVKRVLDGTLQLVGREGEGKLNVKYSSLPLPYDTQYSVLDTDYENFAVVWSCSGIGPVHTQNAWVMTRERLAPNAVLQRAYGVLDRYKISRTFFVKTNQEDCSVIPDPIEAVDPAPASNEAKSVKVIGKNIEDEIVIEDPKSLPVAEVNQVEKIELPIAKPVIKEVIKEVLNDIPQIKSIPKPEELDQIPEENARPLPAKATITVPELILNQAEPERIQDLRAQPAEQLLQKESLKSVPVDDVEPIPVVDIVEKEVNDIKAEVEVTKVDP